MPYVLSAKISSKKPVQLWITGRDTQIANCIYFDRLYSNRPDGLFQGEVTLRLPLPIDPRHIEVFALDGQSGFPASPNGIKIDRNLQWLPINQKFTHFGDPYMDDFLAFTNQIAQYGGTWGIGLKKSPKGYFAVNVVRNIRSIEEEDYGAIVDTPATTYHEPVQIDNRDRTLIEWRQRDLQNRTVCNIWTIMMHEGWHYMGKTENEFACDDFALQHAYGYGFAKYEIEATLIKLFGDCKCNSNACKNPNTCEQDCPCKEKMQRTFAMDQQLEALPDLN